MASTFSTPTSHLNPPHVTPTVPQLRVTASTAPPTAFSSTCHDEFSVASQRAQVQAQEQARIRAAFSGGGGAASGAATGGPTTVAAAAAAAARTTVYKSPFTGRSLLRTLTAVLQSLVGHVVRIELKNESSVKGKLEEIDRATNVRLSQCTTYRSNTAQRPYGYVPPAPIESDSLFISGRSIRYIHLPDRIDIRGTLTRWEYSQDERLLQYKRRKRQGKYITREEQERQVDAKEKKLKLEIEREEAEAAAALLNTDPTVSTSPFISPSPDLLSSSSPPSVSSSSTTLADDPATKRARFDDATEC